jgi:hypothetical protein
VIMTTHSGRHVRSPVRFTYSASISTGGGGDDVGAFHGSFHRLPNRYRGNAYANRYPSNSPINRISIVTNNRNNSCIVASGVYTWVRHKTSTEIYGKTLQFSSVSCQDASDRTALLEMYVLAGPRHLGNWLNWSVFPYISVDVLWQT